MTTDGITSDGTAADRTAPDAPAPSGPRLADVVRLLEERYPPATAESWDAVGTVCGDPSAPVRRVLLAVDPVDAVVEEALAWGADLLVTHHPLFLRPVHSVAATSAKGAVVHRLVRGGCALHVAHTNADAADGGVAEALALAVGLVDLRPLTPLPGESLDKYVVFVPRDGVDALVDAMAEAGAGSLGDYARCAWVSTGTGTFEPQQGASPAVGSVGHREEVAEARVEMIAPRGRRSQVLGALRAAHPYEEPAYDVLELAALPGRTGTGRVGTLDAGATLGEFARRVADALPATPQGVRVAGDLSAPVHRVAVVGGSGDSLFEEVRRAGVDVYLTADLRHHPVSEQRERAAHDAGREGGAVEGRPFLVDVAHWASEWPWLEVAARTLREDLAALGATTVEVRVSTLRTDPWTVRLDQDRPIGGPHP